jgi:phage-related baseplate assembly protein
MVEPFYFTPFSRKRLQTVPEAAGEALPNGAYIFHMGKG